MDSSIKSLTITGAAAEDAMKPRRSSSRKKKPDIQTDEEPFIENAKRIVFGKPAPIEAIPIQPVVVTPPTVAIQATVLLKKPTVPIQPTVIEGGHVIMNPPKQQKVKLQPKSKIQAPIPVQLTRKSRRIHLHNLTQRFTRAKKVRDTTENEAIDTIRNYLIKKGVIQIKSKAPEKMLRSMYSDFMLLKDPAL